MTCFAQRWTFPLRRTLLRSALETGENPHEATPLSAKSNIRLLSLGQAALLRLATALPGPSPGTFYFTLFSDTQQRPNPFSQCPASLWCLLACRFKTQIAFVQILWVSYGRRFGPFWCLQRSDGTGLQATSLSHPGSNWQLHEFHGTWKRCSHLEPS